jgi:hypothetical protein
MDDEEGGWDGEVEVAEEEGEPAHDKREEISELDLNEERRKIFVAKKGRPRMR